MAMEVRQQLTEGAQLSLLGGFRLVVGYEDVALTEATQRLLAFLALHNNRALPRSLIAGRLWPDKLESRAAANLRSCLWRLNGSGFEALVTQHGPSLMLGADIVLDTNRLECIGWHLIDGTDRNTKVSDPDAGLLYRPLLPGWYDDWVVIERERLEQLQIRFLEAYVNRARDRGDYARAVDHALRLVAIDPFRERSQLTLILTLAAEGSWGRAAQQRREYEHLMVQEFGCAPSRAFSEACVSALPLAS